MKFTSPQKFLLESDEELRAKQRRAFGTRDITGMMHHYIDLLRRSKVSHIDIQTAAMFGDDVAMLVCNELKEEPPEITNIEALVQLFTIYKDDMLKILVALYSDRNVRNTQTTGEFSSLRELIGWAIGQIRGRDAYADGRMMANIVARVLYDVQHSGFNISRIKEILRPYFTHPDLRQEAISKMGQAHMKEFLN